MYQGNISSFLILSRLFVKNNLEAGKIARINFYQGKNTSFPITRIMSKLIVYTSKKQVFLLWLNKQSLELLGQ